MTFSIRSAKDIRRRGMYQTQSPVSRQQKVGKVLLGVFMNCITPLHVPLNVLKWCLL